MSKLSIWRGEGSSNESCCATRCTPSHRGAVRGKRSRKLSRAIPGYFETLEGRQLMSLLGITPGYPSLPLDTSTSVMNYTYNSSLHQGALTASGGIPSPITMAPGVQDRITSGTFTINFNVDANGNVLPGQTGPNIILNGVVAALGDGTPGNPVVLLEGTIDKFGFLYNNSNTNNFDATFVPTGGAMESYFSGQDIGISFLSQHNTFVGSFTSNWSAGGGGAQGVDGVAGPVPPIVTVGGGLPQITTTPGGTVVLGSGVALKDTANLTGGNDPTGSITFELLNASDSVVDMETVAVSGAGIDSTPNGYVPNASDGTGTYEWVANYSGDYNNSPVASPMGSEPEVVSPASPAITTTPGGTVVIGSGTPLTDTAILSGGVNPSGSITFTLYGPTSSVVETEVVPVNGNGSYSTPNGFIPTASTGTGTYEWGAAYSGDSDNNPVSSPPTAELEAVTAASPAITTTPGGTVVIGSGTPLTDTAILSGGVSETGTITFTLYSPTNTVVETETVNVNGNGSYTTPSGFIPTASTGTGTYEWGAAYSGDSNNNPVSSPPTAELEAVSAASPQITTTPGGTVVIGSGTPLTDTAILTGGVSETGTITFTLYSPTNSIVETETVNVNGDGSYSTPNGFIPTASTGTYEWGAAYSGDSNNNPVSSPPTAELEAVTAASPAITTTPGGTVVIGSGTPLTDTAILTGGVSETGTITFTLYSPTNSIVETETVNVNGDGSYSTPNGFIPTASTGTGTYEWGAAYSGDSNNNPVSSPPTAELEAVSAASPQITTTPGGTVVIGSGTPLTDTAILTGGVSETGTITFTLYSPANSIVETETVNVNGDGSYTTPNGFIPTASTGTGTYEWGAAYSGDSNNNPVSSPPTAELEAVTAASPQITTTPGGTVVIGSGTPLTDTAILSGGVSETGTITFTLYSPTNTVVETETVAVNGNGSYTTPSGFLPTASTGTGTYEWGAAYSGDSNNNPVSSPPTAELEAVSAASPAITTTPGGTVVIGSGVKLTDTAILSGGVSETGTITFTLYSPTNTVVETETVAVNGNGSYTTPNGFIPTASTGTGTYEWGAAYSGDSNNNPVSSPPTAELEVVSAASPAITTTPGGTVVIGSDTKLTDTAILSGGVSETGTITFTLYSPTNTVVETETVAVNGNGSYTTPSGFLPTASTGTGTYEWGAAYSGDSNNNPVSSPPTAELEVVSAASPAITTTPGGTVVIGSGVKLTDTAILSGGVSETGTITFTLYSPTNTVVETETVAVNGNGSYTTPSGFLPTASTGTGTYEWGAAYSGDSDNNPVSSPKTAELEAVTAASPAITTTPGGTVVIGSGAKLTDTAILSGGVNETGTITFTLYSPTNSVVETETVTVTGNGSYTTPNGFLPTASTGTGTYEWAAAYSGDSNNNPVSSPKTAELEAVTAASPAITTTPGGTVVIGSGAKLTDTAILSGGVSETGTITFTLYSPTNTVVETETVTVSGNGSYMTPNGFLPTASTGTGTYEWAAAYSGDSNNNPVSSPKTAELEAVSAASPAITTTPGGTVVIGSGAKLTDTAILSGGVSETGTITFTLYSPTNTVVETQTVTVNGNGSYTTPSGYLPTGTGTYEWAAAYSGDSNNNPVSSPKTAELEAVTAASPAITTTPGGTVVIGSGVKLTDTTILSGGVSETGTITFTLYSPTNSVVETETVAVNGNGSYTTPNGFLPTASTGTGTYEWAAAYSGDSNNNAVSSPKTAELEAVTAASPAITTTPGGTVVIGSGAKLTDTAILSGGVSETGTITFTLYSPTNSVVETQTVTVNGNGSYTTPTGYVPTGTGTYEWGAAYSGDSNNNPVSSPPTAELEVVSAASPAITTTPGGTVVIGSGAKLTDTAILSGGVSETGTITFTLYSPTNTVVETQTVTVNGNGSYTTPTGYVPTGTGTFEWAAAYSGDSNNNPVSSPKTAELEVVTAASPAITTTPGGTVVIGSGAGLTDTAILTGGYNETGSVTFTLYSPTNAVVETQTVTVNGNGSYTTPTGYVPTSTGTYEWAAAYSGDSNNNAVSSPKTAELEVVSASSPAITTTPGGTVVIGSGAKLTDTAILTGGYDETGTVTFTLYSPTNTVVETQTVTVNGAGSYTTPTGYVPTGTGTYEWGAAYSGDANNIAVSSPPTAELEVVSAASPAINTTPGGTVAIGSGAKLTDSATLSGGYNETGSITFTLYNPNNVVEDTETVTVNGNGTYTTPNGFVPTTTSGAGTYEWAAAYSGDSNNIAVSSPKTAETEVVTAPTPIDLTVCKTVCDVTSPCDISCNFNGTPINGGCYIWFNCDINPTIPSGCNSVTYNFTGCQINFSAGGQNYCVNAPNSCITFSSSCTTASTSYNSSTNCWTTTAPCTGLSGNEFLNGCEFKVPTNGLPGGISNVCWTGDLAATAPNCGAQWQWSAACYNSSFGTNYNNLGIKPCDSNTLCSYKNSDHEGTPENCKSYVCGGATGGGGSNYCGSYSGTQSCSCNMTTAQTCVGDTVMYTVTVSDATGYNTATGVVLSDILPTGISYVSSSSSQGSYSTSTGVWSIGTIAPGGKATLYIFAKSTTYGVFVNTATVTGANQVDVNTNPTASATLIVGAGLSGEAFLDSNGTCSPTGQTPEAGVTVELLDGNGDVVLTTTSNSAGMYSFLGIAPGTYTVEFIAPTGLYIDCVDGTGNNNECGSNGSNGAGCGNYNFNYNGCGYSGYDGGSSNCGYSYSSSGNGCYSYEFCDSSSSNVGNNWSTCGGNQGGWGNNSGGNDCGWNMNSTSATACVTLTCGVTTCNFNVGLLQATACLSGTVYNDITGNGLTSDDTTMSGVTVALYKDVDGNGVLSSDDGSPIATMVSGSNGAYSFMNLAAGKYIVAETTPSGYTETAPNLPGYYAVTLNTGVCDMNLNFDNYHCCMTTLQNVSFQVSGCSTVYTTLNGNTNQGNTVTATFTVPAGAAPMQFSLVSYNCPDPVFNASDASEQTIFQDATGTFGPGVHTLTVTIPNNYYQVDFVCGAAINQFGAAGSNIFYSAQGRLLSSDNDGINSNVTNQEAPMSWWASSTGQNLIKAFGGSASSTTLGNWLASTLPNVFGGTALGNKSNTAVASAFTSYYNAGGQKNAAQVMATALNVYASTQSLGGSTGTSYGFAVSAAGFGAGLFNIGANGAAFGVANNSTVTVSQMLASINSQSANDSLYKGNSVLVNSAYSELNFVNGVEAV